MKQRNDDSSSMNDSLGIRQFLGRNLETKRYNYTEHTRQDRSLDVVDSDPTHSSTPHQHTQLTTSTVLKWHKNVYRYM